jgi:formate/nitrite transporter FocA (FNT family)
MVFSFLFGAIAQSDSSQRILFGLGFSLGLMFVVLTGSFLWTGDAMYVSVALVRHHFLGASSNLGACLHWQCYRFNWWSISLWSLYGCCPSRDTLCECSDLNGT